MSIPRIIHYCWLSGEAYPPLIKDCLKSWKKIMPDYELRLWDINSFDFDQILFTKQALQCQKWAFVSDYIRLYALYTEGGIYLDSDVRVLDRFDNLLENRFFAATDYGPPYLIESAIMGAEAGHPFIEKSLEYYQNRPFILTDNTLDQTVNPRIMSDILAKGWGYDFKNQHYALADEIHIYPDEFFTQAPDDRTCYARHLYAGSWKDKSHCGSFYHFCEKYNMLLLYQNIEYYLQKCRFY